jgi:phosphotransferase system HPr (HPr) family protein
LEIGALMGDEYKWTEKTVSIPEKHRFHMRPASKVAEASSKFESEMQISINGVVGNWNPKSIIEMIMFAADFVSCPTNDLVLRVKGKDAEEALGTITSLLQESLFD